MVAWIEDHFFSAKLRIERAKSHLDTLEGEFEQFFKDKPERETVEREGEYDVYKLKFDKRFPVHWRVIATELIEDLRSSLDHAAFATYAAFPFGNTAADLDNSIKGRSRDLRQEIQTLLRSFNAYKGGNDLLYTLNVLANNCKHSLVAFIIGGVAKYELRLKRVEGVEVAEPFVWDAEKNEIAYARVKAGTGCEHKGKISVFVAMPNVPHLPGDSEAIAVLENIGKEVARVVDAIETESRRIGILQ
jgi:hypothetical protein